MRLLLGLSLLSALCLLSQAHLASAQSLPASENLPGGGDGLFRARMLDWSVAETATASQPLESTIGPSPQVRLPRLSSRFGDRRHPMGGRVRHHAGIDIPGPLGTPVLAVAEGAVIRAGWSGGYGIMIEVEHHGGLRSRYAHLSRALVAPGTPVAQGQAIGAMGSTGRSTGSHLHFEVRRDGLALDPLDFLGGPGVSQVQPIAPLEPIVPHRSRFSQMRDITSDSRTGS